MSDLDIIIAATVQVAVNFAPVLLVAAVCFIRSGNGVKR